MKLDDILDSHLQEIRAGHDSKLKAAIIAWAKGLVPEAAGVPELGVVQSSTRDTRIGYNVCCAEVLAAIEREAKQ